MLKKTFRRFGALVMVMALAVSVFAVSASAVDGNTLTIKKTVTADGNTYAPNASFTFSIAPAVDDTYEGNGVYAGVAGGAYFATGANTITYSADDGIIDATNGKTKTTTISTDHTKFVKPGIYHYTVTETAGSYEGITYDTTARDLYVYVVNDTDASNSLKVSSVVLAKTVTEIVNKDGTPTEVKTVVKDEEWTNDYGQTYDTTHDVKIIKAVTGSQGDKNMLFTFTVSVTGAADERYKVVYKTASTDATENETYVDSANSTAADATKNLSIAIKDTGYIQIYGLTDTDTYTVTENSYTKDGYTTTVDGVQGESLIATGNATADGTTRTVTNDKDVTPPTGVITTIAPYALMLVVAGAFAVVFLTRRNRAE